VDGTSLERILRDPSAGLPRDGVLLESLAKHTDVIPTYCGFRTERHVYVRYSTGEEELYDLRQDPDQLQNRASDPRERMALEALRAKARARCVPPDDAFRWGP
jgi:hypothetical protein